MISTAPKTAIIAGASGLVGSHCLDLLLQSNRYKKVISIGRKLLPMEHPKLEQKLVDFEILESYHHSLMADDIFCCLGTTIKKAGSKENFYKVDFTYVIKLASITAANFASQFLVVSAMGADANSRIFYNQVKGKMEAAIKPLHFLGVHLFQPSLLLGQRTEKRMGEQVAQAVAKVLPFVFIGPLRPYKPIHARDVAKAMLYAAAQDGAGISIYPSSRIATTAKFFSPQSMVDG
ncbi:oxidoreductase [Adhaeribacter arboris]|uniref:Oxidoreductase n=1 Tax=Adhaeribacter arboris TaxID=2072846 RepID=A0A2T2Y9D8_9BACT|nr:oxidoreductase [Adhaeribacter arboris]PSR52127.1 oxidoreductase [Adhaeribacter arboris]